MAPFLNKIVEVGGNLEEVCMGLYVLYVHTEGVELMHNQLLTLATPASRVEGREGKLLDFSLTLSLSWYAFYIKRKNKLKAYKKVFSFEKKKGSAKSHWAV